MDVEHCLLTWICFLIVPIVSSQLKKIHKIQYYRVLMCIESILCQHVSVNLCSYLGFWKTGMRWRSLNSTFILSWQVYRKQSLIISAYVVESHFHVSYIQTSIQLGSFTQLRQECPYRYSQQKESNSELLQLHDFSICYIFLHLVKISQ